VGIRDDKELADNPGLDRIVGVDNPDEVIQRIAGQTRVLRPALKPEIARMLVDGRSVVYALVKREPDTAYAYEGRFYQRVGSTSQAISEAMDPPRFRSRTK
jgi:predicted HTH transcriptional regulator